MEDALSFADGVGGGSTAGDGQFVCFAYAHKWRLRRGVADLLTIASRSPPFLLCGPIRERCARRDCVTWRVGGASGAD